MSRLEWGGVGKATGGRRKVSSKTSLIVLSSHLVLLPHFKLPSA